MSASTIDMPRFATETEEADWWASPAGRDFAAARSSEAQDTGKTVKGSRLVAKLNRKPSVQIAIRIPEADLAEARRIADSKGLGYQTLLKMLVHEGLQREMGQQR